MRFPSNTIVATYEFRKVIEFPKYGETRPQGTDGRFLQVLSEALKFSYTLVDPGDNQDGNMKKDGNWTGLVGMLMRGEADMAIGFLPVTEYRRRVVDFTVPYTEGFLTFATKLPGMLSKIYSYWHIFDISTWIGLLILIFTLPVVFLLLSDGRHSYIDVMLKLFGNVIRQPLGENVGGGKYLKGSWWLFTTVVSLSYAAALSSFLAVPLQEKPIETFEQLDEVIRHGGYKVYSVRGSAFIFYLHLTKKQYALNIAEAVDANDWYIDWHEIWNDSIFKPKTAFLVEKISAELWFGKRPLASKFIADPLSVQIDVAIMVSKKFCCKKKLDTVIIRTYEAGLYRKFLADEQYKTWLRYSNPKLDSNRGRQLSLNDVSGGFVMLLIGYCVSAIVLMVEIAFVKVKLTPLLSNLRRLC